MTYANDYAVKDGKFRLHCISFPGVEYPKSDAFLLEYEGSFTLIDGGVAESTAPRDYLLGIRKALLKDHPELLEDENCKLRINWQLSHFHKDHVCATYTHVMPCPYIEFDEIYLPPDSHTDPKYNWAETDQERYLRPELDEAIAKYCPEAKRHDFGFGADKAVKYSTGKLKIDLLPPTSPSTKEERVRFIIDRYYRGNETHKMIPISITNSASVWVYIKYGRHTFLLTGDTMKKTTDGYEILDEMLDTYGIKKVNVLKYIHHGVNRDEAAAVHANLHPGWIIETSDLATVAKALKESAPKCRAKIVNCHKVTQIFETDGHHMRVFEAE